MNLFKQKQAKNKLLEFIQLAKDGYFDDELYSATEEYCGCDLPFISNGECNICGRKYVEPEIEQCAQRGMSQEEIESLICEPCNKPKLELDLLKEKYATGNYIALSYSVYTDRENYWYKAHSSRSDFENFNKVKLIHIKHKPILDAYLTDNSVKIEYNVIADYSLSKEYKDITDFIDTYNEYYEYRLKPQTKYPIHKRNAEGEVVMFTDEHNCQFVLTNNQHLFGFSTTTANDASRFKFLTDAWQTIPFDSTNGLYHFQPVWCTHPDDRHTTISFYNSKDTFFEECGSIEPITLDQLKTMPFIWDMYQQVLKDNK